MATWQWRFAVVGLLALNFAGALSADEATAKKYVQEANDAVETKSWDQANKKLELAEAELEGVPATAADKVRKEIAQVKETIAAQTSSYEQKKLLRDLERAMKEAESAIGNLATWEGAKDDAMKLFDSPEAKKLIPTEIQEARKRFDTFAKLHAKKAVGEYQANAERELGELEKRWKEYSEKLKDSPSVEWIESESVTLTRWIKDLREALDKLPADNAMRVATEKRVAAMEKELNATLTTSVSGDVARRLKEAWERDLYNSEGWESESANISFEEFSKETSERTSAFGYPKTLKVVHAADAWLKNRETDEAYQSTKAAAPVKAAYDTVADAHAKGLKKLETAAETLVSQAEKLEVNNDNSNGFQRLEGAIKFNLNSSPKAIALAKRVTDRLELRTANEAKQASETAGWYKEATTKASQDWASIKGKYSVSTGFDPTKPGASAGKLFATDTDNLMGYRFKPGDFPFATTINGHPVAARYAPGVEKAVQQVKAKLGRDLGDSDDDGRWDIVYRVEGTTGQLMARKTAEGDVTLNGSRVGTYREEYSEPVSAAIVTIVAAHCGPLAVGDSAGAAASGGGGFMGFLNRTLWLVLAMGTALTLLAEAGFPPAKHSSVEPYLTQYAPLIAIVAALVGLYAVYSLLLGMFRGLLPVGAVAAAALLLAGMLATKQKWLPASAIEKVRPYAIPVGLAAAGLTVLAIFTRGSWYII
jgi:hypothetical protein